MIKIDKIKKKKHFAFVYLQPSDWNFNSNLFHGIIILYRPEFDTYGGFHQSLLQGVRKLKQEAGLGDFKGL